MKQEELLSLLGDMSLEEKVMQLVQLPGWEFDGAAAVTGVAEGAIPAQVLRLCGSTLSIWGAQKLRRIQTEYMKDHPHHIPLLFMLDVIHGHKTVFPCPLGQGATFDPELTEQAAGVQAMEAAADGIHVTFSPMADLVRDARWGRVMESTGEDPVLNGRMAAAMVRGYQGNLDRQHVASCVKHFAAYGAAEAGRDYTNTELSEHTLREQYLPAYQEAVKAGAKLVMTAFNTWNGIPCSGNPKLMQQILRQEMGFDGVLISDWGAVGELISHGFAEDAQAAACSAMGCGVDIDMCAGVYASALAEQVRQGQISEQALDAAVLRVLTLKNDLGLFEDPFRGLPEDGQGSEHPAAESRALARKAVQESLVLLENKGDLLPLHSDRIAFIGPYADSHALHSSWALGADPADTVSIAQAAEERFGAEHIRMAPGCTMLDNDMVIHQGFYHSDTWEADNERLLAEAIAAAQWADTIVLCLGEDRYQSGESTSRTCLQIPKIQQKLLERVHGAGKPIVSLIFCGRPLELADIRRQSDALLVCWMPGTEGGHGIVDILSGDVGPQGKLPMSFPWTTGQEPLHYNAYSTGRPRPAGEPSDFTSRYLDCPNEALYPFGSGLTYTDFAVSQVTLSADTLQTGGSLTAAATITNTGSRTGTETLQLYIRDLVGSRVRPVKELKDFRKLTLGPGESREIRFTITEDMLRFWTIRERFESEPGSFRVWIGTSSDVGAGTDFRLI